LGVGWWFIVCRFADECFVAAAHGWNIDYCGCWWLLPWLVRLLVGLERAVVVAGGRGCAVGCLRERAGALLSRLGRLVSVPR
jgi:hypothetical protein